MQKDSPADQKCKDTRERAIALQYQDLHALPTIAAAGVGALAREILALAKEHQVPIQKDAALTEMLSAMRVGQAVTPESFRLIAEIVSFLYHADKEWRDHHPFLEPVLGLKELP